MIHVIADNALINYKKTIKIMKVPRLQAIELSSKSNQTMKKELIKDTGQFLAEDKRGNKVRIEWHVTKMIAPEFAQLMRNIAQIGIEAFTSVEMQFLKKHSEIVGSEAYFKSFEPLFKNGLENVDWQEVEKQMRQALERHFIFDASKFSEQMIKAFENDQVIFMAIKNAENNELLGYGTFTIRVNFCYGDVKLTGLAIKPSDQNRGLAKLIMSSIFKIMPHASRIFLSTRVTNESALRAYRSWGFEVDQNPAQDGHQFNPKHWTFMEYKAQYKNSLQKVAQMLKKN